MDVIGIDMLWNAEVSLGFSQLSSPEGKFVSPVHPVQKMEGGKKPFSLKANE